MSEQKKTGCVAGGCGLLLAIIIGGSVISFIFGSKQVTPPAPVHRTKVADSEVAPVAAPIPAPEPEKTAKELAQEKTRAWESEGEDAFIWAQQDCKKYLKSPSTAKFTDRYSDKDTGFAEYGYHQWIVAGYVDGQNSFGATLRQSWGAIVEVSDKSYSIPWLEIGDSQYGQKPAIRPYPPHKITAAELAAQKAQAELAKIEKEKRLAAAKQKTFAWYSAKATNNDAFAQFRLAELYRDGEGIATNLPAARQWFAKAASSGCEDAKKALQEIDKNTHSK